jgi:hypothetical protein
VGLLFGLAVLVAAAVWVARGMARRRARRWVADGPGSSPERAIAVHAFEDMDAAVGTRRCPCGERLRATGEGSREIPPHRYRFARLACDECQEETVLWFDVTAVRM